MLSSIVLYALFWSNSTLGIQQHIPPQEIKEGGRREAWCPNAGEGRAVRKECVSGCLIEANEGGEGEWDGGIVEKQWDIIWNVNE